MKTQITAQEFQTIVFVSLRGAASRPTSKTTYDANNMNPDIVVCFDKPNSAHFLRTDTCDMLLQMGFDASQFATALASVPQKQIKRTTQFLNGCASRDLDTIDLATVGILATTLRFEGQVPKHALAYYALTGKGDENTSDLTRGVGFSKLHAYIAERATTGKRVGVKMGMGTATTQTSRTIGKQGFLYLLDVAHQANDGATVLNMGSPLTARFIETAERALSKVWG